MQPLTLVAEVSDVALWRRHAKRTEQTVELPLDPNRSGARKSTQRVIQQVDEYAQRLAAAVERAERLAPLLLDDGPEGDAHA